MTVFRYCWNWGRWRPSENKIFLYKKAGHVSFSDGLNH
ncbi:hypothetical protein NMH_0205 [Neisseria meningitidis H44/76]|uniref:Uncharacterized protein n=3 Tax=Neisseria meningitidis TaxID=487 RepID=A0A0H5DLR2_NEIMI|nr:hypothetical protein NMH_0205 [Neisseria meningitidis H44/76]CCA45668.1 hypothetical protein NMALPHA522_2127 [Neisseria meningitidis alpha522]CRL92290.1 hypothetical protein [Neisseria meningitidis serogroup B]